MRVCSNCAFGVRGSRAHSTFLKNRYLSVTASIIRFEKFMEKPLPGMLMPRFIPGGKFLTKKPVRFCEAASFHNRCVISSPYHTPQILYTVPVGRMVCTVVLFDRKSTGFAVPSTALPMFKSTPSPYHPHHLLSVVLQAFNDELLSALEQFGQAWA